MKNPNWPACVSNLKPFRPRNDPPAVIVELFRAQGWDAAAPLPIQMVALLGSCSTGAFPDCPTLPEWHTSNAAAEGGDFLDEIGRYSWCDFDLIDAKGTRTELRMAFNDGDADCNDGVWGVVWDRRTGKVVAELTSVGDSEGLIKVVAKGHLEKFAPHKLPIPTDRNSFGAFMSPTTLKFAKSDQMAQLIAVAIGWCSGYR